MYIAKHYFETRFKQNFKKGDTVPDDIAKFYRRDVEELLIDDSSNVEAKIENSDLEETLIEENLDLEGKFKSKKELEEYARTQGIELDRRKSMKNMIRDFLKFQ